MWYAVNLLFKSVHPGHPENESLWEERIVLVRADSEEDARHEGEKIGKSEEVEYVAANCDLVRWTFQQVERACEVETLEHGSELFSRFLHEREVESILTPFED